MDKVNMRKNKNRRVFFRIFDEVNLFYKKIDEKLVTEPHSIFDNILNDPSLSADLEMVSPDSALLLPGLEKNLPDVMTPDLPFNEHETCNISISASGMAFNCEDALEEGDYLVIKILLVSSMTVIVAYGKIVYCINNQANDSQYPYFVGVHFINMEDQCRGLLITHVANKRKKQFWVNGFILLAVIIVLAAPDLVFGLLSGLLHFLFELILHILHLAFEFIESNLDHLVEHFFHTDVHQTQIIVFYIIVPFVVYGLYRLLRAVPPFCLRCKRNQIAYWSRKKAGLLYYWRELVLIDKIKTVVIGITAVACYIFFGF